MSNILLQAGWCFAASLFLPVLVWAAMPLMPRSAALRHLLWVAVFAVLLALPLLVPVVPSQIVLHPAAAPVAVGPAPVLPAPRGWHWVDTLALLPLLWLAGVIGNLARLALGLFGLSRLRAGSAPFDDMRNVRLADEGPMTFGWLAPLILLPREAQDWPAERLVAVLAHERAHVRRRDSLTQILAQLVCAFYWPNPLLWLGARSLRREAELAADDAVLASGMRASDYAAQLLQLAGERRPIGAVAMAAPSLEARVKSVLSATPVRTGVSIVDGVKIACMGSAAVVALALVRPAIAEAQDPSMVQSAPLPAPAAPARLAAPAAAAAAPAPVAAPARASVPVQAMPVADVIPPAPPVPAAPVADMSPPAPPVPSHYHRHFDVTVHADGLSDANQARIDAAVARATVERLRPQTDRAMQQARAEQAAAQSVQQAMPQVHAAIAQAMAQIRPVVHQVFADKRVDVKVSVVLDHVQQQIGQAVVHVERDVERDVAYAQQDAEREAARAARANAHGRDENSDPGDINPNP